MKFYSDGMYWLYDEKTKMFCHPNKKIDYFSLEEVISKAKFSPSWKQFLDDFTKAKLKHKLCQRMS